MVRDLTQQIEMLDLAVQRVEHTFLPERPDDHDVFRNYSFRLGAKHREARLLRKRIEAAYASFVRKKKPRWPRGKWPMEARKKEQWKIWI